MAASVAAVRPGFYHPCTTVNALPLRPPASANASRPACRNAFAPPTLHLTRLHSLGQTLPPLRVGNDPQNGETARMNFASIFRRTFVSFQCWDGLFDLRAGLDGLRRLLRPTRPRRPDV